MKQQRRRPAHAASARRFGRRRLLGGMVALAGAAGVAAVLEEAINSGASVTDSSLPQLSSRVSSQPGPHETAHSYVTRPDLRPPRVLVDTYRSGQDAGLIITECHAGTEQEGPLIFEPGGELVWFLPLGQDGSADRRAFNVRRQVYKGKPVITYFDGEVYAGHGRGVYRILDSNYRLIQTVEAQRGLIGDLHEFVITPEGTALFTTYGEASADLSSLGGPSDGTYWYGEAQEVDLATGKLLFYWRSDEHVPFEDSYYPMSTDTWDYFHMNSINVDPRDNNLVISSRMCWTAFKVNRKTGAIMWRLGGKKNDFEMGKGASFAWQHDVTPQPDHTFTIFDNECGPTHKPSRGLVLAVNEEKMRANLLTQYQHHPALKSAVLGSVQNLPGKHRFVGWGTTSYFTEYGPGGEVLLDGHLDGKGVESYRAFKERWTGLPAVPPDVAVHKTASGSVVYVSWNGATNVARWQVNAGASPSTLKPVGVAAKEGFETAITLPDAPSYVQVEALDENGASMRRSRVVKSA